MRRSRVAVGGGKVDCGGSASMERYLSLIYLLGGLRDAVMRGLRCLSPVAYIS